MTKQIHLWIEDKEGKSGFIFWKTFMRELFPEINVESKKNNSELVKAVKDITNADRYIIVMDNSFDNPEVYREQSRLNKYSAGKDVVKINLICFEYLLLEFKGLFDWIYAKRDDFREKRKIIINARNTLISIITDGNMNYKQAEEIAQYDSNLEKRNIEQLAAKLLYDLTRNTGFEVTKGKLVNVGLNPVVSGKLDRKMMYVG